MGLILKIADWFRVPRDTGIAPPSEPTLGPPRIGPRDKRAPRLPGPTDRLLIIGQTGSGKTQAGVWHLSKMDWHEKPWIIYDFKGDDLLNEIGATELPVSSVPDKPGLYIVHPLPHQSDEVESQMWKLWARENTGIYVDEGYMVDNSAWNAILTQGRSKHIPVIVLAQRPAWLTRFMLSEVGYFQVFYVQHPKDRERLKGFIPSDTGASLDERLPKYHSYYYDVGSDSLRKMAPVPDRQAIITEFESRMNSQRDLQSI